MPQEQRAPRLVTDDLDAARAFQAEALDRGHEGVVLEALESPYEAGRRGGAWLEVKPRHTLDLVVLAVEHGSGPAPRLAVGPAPRRAGPGRGSVLLGETFKGLTAELLAWQTDRLRELAVDHDGGVVRVRPELVVEVVLDGV